MGWGQTLSQELLWTFLMIPNCSLIHKHGLSVNSVLLLLKLMKKQNRNHCHLRRENVMIRHVSWWARFRRAIVSSRRIISYTSQWLTQCKAPSRDLEGQIHIKFSRFPFHAKCPETSKQYPLVMYVQMTRKLCVNSHKSNHGPSKSNHGSSKSNHGSSRGNRARDPCDLFTDDCIILRNRMPNDEMTESLALSYGLSY